MKAITRQLDLLIALIIVAGIATACGGGDSSSASSSTPANEPAPMATVTATPTAEPTNTPRPTATVPPTATAVAADEEPSLDDQIAQGKLIFEKTAGGVGCALCHGMDAMGDPAQGAPSNIGATAETIEAALYDRPQMSFISLTRDEIHAVAAYLKRLEELQQ